MINVIIVIISSSSGMCMFKSEQSQTKQVKTNVTGTHKRISLVQYERVTSKISTFFISKHMTLICYCIS